MVSSAVRTRRGKGKEHRDFCILVLALFLPSITFLSSLSNLEVAREYLLVEDGPLQVFIQDLIDLEVRPWYGDIERDKHGYFLELC